MAKLAKMAATHGMFDAIAFLQEPMYVRLASKDLTTCHPETDWNHS